MKIPHRFLPNDRWIEPFLALVVAGGLTYIFFYFHEHGFLPQPFFYDVSDTWMDWFNTAVWAHDDGMYDSWGTVYPPLTFVVMRFIGKQSCYVTGGPFAARDCDWIGTLFFHGLFFLNAILIYLSFRKIDRSTAFPRAFALSFGLPMLGAWERANIFLLCVTCMVLGYGPLLKSARMRWLGVAVTINLKVYMIAALFPQLIKRRWRWFEGAVLATLALYLVTYLILGHGTPAEIYENVTGYGVGGNFSPLDLWASVSYKPMVALIFSDFPLSGLIGSRSVDFMEWALPLSIQLTQLSIIAAVIAAAIRPEAIPMYRLTNFALIFTMITQETGGSYTPTLFIFLVFMEPWRGIGRRLAIVACYVLCFPFDLIIDRILDLVNESFLGGRPVLQTYYVMVGFFIRPGLNLLVAAALASTTLYEVWIDIDRQKWKTRWRFRHDLPILMGAGKARPPR